MGISGGVWHVAREYEGIAEAGGLKDVVTGLATALVRRGIPSTVVLPRYGFVEPGRLDARELPFRVRFPLPSSGYNLQMREETVQAWEVRREGVRLLLLDAERTRAKRSIYTFTAEDAREDPARREGEGHWDAHQVNLLLQRGALELALYLRQQAGEAPPAVFHCHDGHAAFLPAILRETDRYRSALPQARTLVTIHNAGWGYHQEIYGLEFAARVSGLARETLRRAVPADRLAQECVDPLLLCPEYCPVNTVSEEYAREIMSGELDAVTGGLGREYRRRGFALLGITNGIDPRGFDPRFPESSGLPCRFDPSSGNLEGKRLCRALLLKELGESRLEGVRSFGSLEPQSDDPLYTFIGRLAEQKGVDILAGAAARLLSARAPVRFLLLGQGSPEIENRLAALAAEAPARGRFLLLAGYQPALARRIYAAGDFFLIPSLFEPCGLTDFYAQLMGSLPIAHRVGGLVKVRDGYNGFGYREHSVPALLDAILRSLKAYRQTPELLDRMRRQAFQEIYQQHTWDRVLARGYLPLYGFPADP
jgi:starch synthase